jgi:hypothetical protein
VRAHIAGHSMTAADVIAVLTHAVHDHTTDDRT